MVRREPACTQRGFTLLELLLAVAIFALLAAGTSQLLAAFTRADAAHQAHADELRALGRAMSVMQRDALQGYWPASGKNGTSHGILLTPHRVSWLLGAERDRQPLPRSDLRVVEYWLEDGVLWRQRRTLEHGQVRPQRVLDGIVELRWRMYGAESGWVSSWTAAQPPQALEITLSTQRFQGIRRVLPMAGASL
ncbi:type II secretion system protein GspJ [Pseudomonas monteilii]|uniref:Type II secretion system minor pseudopilin GspJ n=1 Tax=Pseudomonas kurunegalensis TaxID=485880 RepID=A0ACC5UIX9_9PSED|nr:MULTISPECIES: type II secretion system minor pseudopilin GspJ [Pseudomonas]AVH36496.1 type II secretion system protein GspJ [Pseudomonas monteilii]MBV4514386.1 type II secretion system minor pseudopilin GspJ [Pseudomonas kurunegalensis]MBZ3662767.1 type II secretion system minor pseudopilin GspJ [Pseudomonas monteilii]MBZ3668093.1 type II secretion system minor pseudopilin GspJ [Pseudomonas monteilii]